MIGSFSMNRNLVMPSCLKLALFVVTAVISSVLLLLGYICNELALFIVLCILILPMVCLGLVAFYNLYNCLISSFCGESF
jgi:hypothetical protein